jgi:hypothetical protein
MSAMQSRLMKRVTSFLLASGPTWRPQPPPLSQLPHCHLYSSSRRFPVVPKLTFGFSHKIPNRTSITSGSAHKVRQGMYCPMFHLDSSLGLGAATDGVLPTSQAFFYLDINGLDPCSSGRLQAQGTKKLLHIFTMAYSAGSSPLLGGVGTYLYPQHKASDPIYNSVGVAFLSGHCCHVKRKVPVHLWKHQRTYPLSDNILALLVLCGWTTL